LAGAWSSHGSMGVHCPMFDSYNYPAGNHGGDSKVILHHVPPGKYHLYLYGHGTSPAYYGNYEVTVGNVNYGRLRTSSGPDALQNTNWVEGSQYVCFRGLTVSPGADVEILIRPGAPTTTTTGRTIADAIICGLQLIPVEGPPSL